VKALQDWRPYLADTEKSIQIYTDHKNLRNFATTKQLNWWQVCWAKQLADYKFQIHYKKVMRMMKQTLWVDSLITRSEKIHMKFWVKMKRNPHKGLAAMYKVKQASWQMKN
jgi:hypothetical protein